MLGEERTDFSAVDYEYCVVSVWTGCLLKPWLCH